MPQDGLSLRGVHASGRIRLLSTSRLRTLHTLIKRIHLGWLMVGLLSLEVHFLTCLQVDSLISMNLYRTKPSL